MLLLRTSKQFREVRKILHRCVDTIANKIHLFYIVPPPCFLLISPLYLFLFSVKIFAWYFWYCYREILSYFETGLLVSLILKFGRNFEHAVNHVLQLLNSLSGFQYFKYFKSYASHLIFSLESKAIPVKKQIKKKNIAKSYIYKISSRHEMGEN